VTVRNMRLKIGSNTLVNIVSAAPSALSKFGDIRCDKLPTNWIASSAINEYRSYLDGVIWDETNGVAYYPWGISDDTGRLSGVMSANGAGFAIKNVTALLSAVNGATVTATNLIPAGSFVLGVTTRITTALGTGGGTTGYQVGDGSDADRWGVSAAVTLGTQTGQAASPATANPTGYFASAQSVVITAAGGSFNGTGAIRVVASYIDLTAPTS
jgi:hypothetical protein